MVHQKVPKEKKVPIDIIFLFVENDKSLKNFEF